MSSDKLAKDIASKRSECVKVVVRVRPLFGVELKDGRKAVTSAHDTEIRIQNPKADEREMPKAFTYDATYGANATQAEIYETTAAPIVESVMQGYNGTIFAYGQTGAGKTHTMEGKPDPPELRGIIPNSFKDIFHKISLNTEETTQFLVRASYLEIYNEEIRDLLSKNPTNRLELKESVDSGVFVKDLTSFVVKSAAEIDTLMQAGKKNRSTGATKMNSTSSRSHSIFTITVETSDVREDGESHIRVGKLNMVDLAGSERQSKTGATGQRLKEATKINLSLSALGNVISALVDSKSSHIPYRDSKLTRLLQDSLGGNTKTVMIANCGPADYNYDETLSTLRYASRAKQIKNKPKINEDPKDAMLREFQEEIERLRRELSERPGAGAGGGGGGGGSGAGAGSAAPEVRIEERVVEKLVGVSEDEVQAMKEAAEKEKEALLAKTQAEREALLKASAATEEEKKKLAEELARQAAEQERVAAEKENMERKLKAMQEKLLVGGQIIDQAAKKEEELRRATLELEERKRQETTLARELEEANMMIEEQYASMQEEVEVKTKKLKKVWQKWQQASTEVKDLQREFQTEREDLLDTIRELQRQLKLKQIVIDNFIPPAEVQRVEARAVWDDETDEYTMPRLELSGNSIRAPRPQSDSRWRRPESEYARRRATYDNNPRYKTEDVGQLELDMPERTTMDYDGAAMSHKVQAALDAALVGEEEDDVMKAPSTHQESRKHKRSSKEKKSRPSTARRKRGGESEKSRRDVGADEPESRSAYPSARGLVSRDP